MMRDARTALYRFFDEADRLLYVGVAFAPRERWKVHARQKRWWSEVRTREIEWYPCRAEAERAEEAAIAKEKPKYNVLGNVPVRPPAQRRRPPREKSEQTIEELIARMEAMRRPPGTRRVDPDLPPPAERQRLRRDAKWSQADMADVLQVNRVTVSAWERGQYDPTGDTRRQYIQVLKGLQERLSSVPPG